MTRLVIQITGLYNWTLTILLKQFGTDCLSLISHPMIFMFDSEWSGSIKLPYLLFLLLLLFIAIMVSYWDFYRIFVHFFQSMKSLDKKFLKYLARLFLLHYFDQLKKNRTGPPTFLLRPRLKDNIQIRTFFRHPLPPPPNNGLHKNLLFLQICYNYCKIGKDQF